MRPGDVLAERFEIERKIGRGGMGSVFLATDRSGGGPVAVKVLEEASDDAHERFARESAALALLSHEGIVRYVTHNADPPEPYLVMEWLEGEDLGVRLARGRLSIEQSLALIRGAAEALAFAHANGVVHRDVKPSNLFLLHGAPDHPKLLDFGIARLREGMQALTDAGTMLGTVGYMAPEQATGEPDVDFRADIFSLGCVLFECLTGRPAFAGRHAIAVLAKVLREEVMRPSECRADVGPSLDALIARMMAKNRTDRPRDAGELLEHLRRVEASPARSAPVDEPGPPPSVTRAEQRIVSILLAEPPQGIVAPFDLTKLEKELGSGLSPIGGGLVLVISGSSVATDLALEAVRAAEKLSAAVPSLRIAVATGLAETTGRSPVGPAIDRAAALLRPSAADARSRTEPGVFVDEVTTRLLRGRFHLENEGRVGLDASEHPDADAPHLFMGEATPTVGREHELAQLDIVLDECIEDRVPRAVLVTAPPGVGKSRLARDFIARARKRPGIRVLVAAAEAVAAGSAFALARTLLRTAVGFTSDEEATSSQGRLRDYVAARTSEDRVALLVEFLGEIAGVPSSMMSSPILRAARNDPNVMREQKRRAFEAWVDLETARGPLLIVLEDVHWGDLPTLTYLGEALRRSSSRSLFVLGLARPEVHETFPKLWDGLPLREVRLPGVADRAARELSRFVLGDGADSSVVERAIARAEGNVFYLEEMLRCIATGERDLPETVLAMVQSRLERVEPEARRVLRASSVFGETFWAGGVVSLLGNARDTAHWLELMVERELIRRAPVSRFAGEAEYMFRHALLKDAAYGMLTAADRRTAHRLVGEWLEKNGFHDARVLADHFEAGEETARAIMWLCRAAATAASSDDLASATALSNRGLSLGASGAVRGELLIVRALAAFVAHAEVDVDALSEAVTLLPERTAPWWLTVSLLIYGYATLGRAHDGLPFVQLMLATPPGEDLVGPYGWGVATTTVGLTVMGQGSMISAYLSQFAAVGLDDPRCDPEFAACLSLSRGLELLWVRGTWNPEASLELTQRGLAIARATGAAIAEVSGVLFTGLAWDALGQHGRAVEQLTKSIEVGSASLTGVYGRLYLERRRIRTAGSSDTNATLRELLEYPEATIRSAARALLAEACLGDGRPDLALPLALTAVEGAPGFFQNWGAAALARAYLGVGDAEAALRVLRAALAEGSSSLAEVDADLLTSECLALRALGDLPGAQDAATRARSLVTGVAGRICDSSLRASFLAVAENARALALVN